MPLGAYDHFCADFKRQSYGQEKALHLFFFGPIKKYKGADTLIDAMKICREKGVSATLTIAGSQASDTHIIDPKEVESLGILWLNRYVEDSEVCRLLGEADVMVIPYKNATQTTPGALALGYGMPVIATRSGGLTEQVENGVNGLLVEPDNAVALASAIQKMAEERELLKKFSQGALRLYRTKFSWNIIAKNLIEKYRLICVNG